MANAPLMLASALFLAAGLAHEPSPALARRAPQGPAAAATQTAPPAAPAPAGPTASLAAPAAPGAEQTYLESIDVDVVSVEVFANDRHGNPVRGLGPRDFTVLEDGKPVAVSNFFGPGAAGGDLLPGAAAQAAPGEDAARQAPAAAVAGAARGPDLPESQRLDLAILIDNSTLTPQTRNRVLSSLRDLLTAHLRREDRVMVASSGRQLAVIQEPTADRAAVAEALERIAGEAGAGVHRAMDLRLLVEDMARALPVSGTPKGNAGADPTPTMREQAASAIRSFVQQREQEGRAALERLAQFVDSLGGLPGRKALLYVSGGISLRPGEAVIRTFEAQFSVLLAGNDASPLRPFLDARAVDLTPVLRQVVERANASGVTLYPMLSGSDESGRGADSAGSLAWSENAATEQLNRKEGMLQLAAETGGVAALEPADPAGFLGSLARDLGTYYSLGYASPHPHDGKVHRIQVVPRDPELRLRYRASYRDRSGDDRIRARTLSALLYGVETNPLGMALEFSDERRDDKGQMQVDLLVKIPMANLVLLPRERFHHGRLTLYVGARGRQGWISTLTRITLPIQLGNEQLLTAAGQVASYRTTLTLRPEETVIAIGVRDELSQAESTLYQTYVPGQAVGASSRA